MHPESTCNAPSTGSSSWARYNPKLRVLWFGVVVVAVLNFCVVVNEHSFHAQVEINIKSASAEHNARSESPDATTLRFVQSVKQRTTQAAAVLISDSLSDSHAPTLKEEKYSVQSSSTSSVDNGSVTSSNVNRASYTNGERATEHEAAKISDARTEGLQINTTMPTVVKAIQTITNATTFLTPVLSRPLTCNGCFRTEFSYTGGEHICKSIRDGSPDQVDIFIIVTTAYTHLRNRATLRNTWLTRTRDNTAKVRYAFFLGQTSNYQLTKYVAREAEHYRDVVIADFSDSYNNLTYKTMAAFQWVYKNCGQVKYVMKTDDDMYVNVGNLISLTTRFRGLLQSRVLGSCKKHSPVRLQSSKYYIPTDVYPFAEYPTTCSGTGYVTSIKVVEKIIRTSPNVPYFPLEDVYVALCLDKSGLGTRRYQGFLSSVPSSAPLCIFKGRIVITGHIRNWRTIEEIWNLECDTNR